MDVAAFLCNLTPTDSHSIASKRRIIEGVFGRDHGAQNDSLPRGIWSHTFGRATDDAYFTALFAASLSSKDRVRLPEAAFFNKVVLQLTYQVRYLLDNIGPEAAVVLADDTHFNIAMANAGSILGIKVVSNIANPTNNFDIAWHQDSGFGTNKDVLTTSEPGEIPDWVARHGRQLVGAVLVDLGLLEDSVVFSDLFPGMDMVSDKTIYGIVGPAEPVLAAALEFELLYPEAVTYCVTYNDHADPAGSTRGILVCWNVPELPKVSVRPMTPRLCRLFELQNTGPREGMVIKNYRAREEVLVKPPLTIVSSAPLSDELRSCIDGRRQQKHEFVEIKGGRVTALDTPGWPDYVYYSPAGDMAVDAGNHSGYTKRCYLYEFGKTLPNGDIEAIVPARDVVYVSGYAMPLLFTPLLHTFFSHFMIQCFPRLLALELLGCADAKIIVPHDIRRKQVEMILAFGVTEDRIIFQRPEVTIEAEHLLVHRPWELFFSELSCQAYQRLMHRLGVRRQPTNKRVLISREYRRSWRNMVNFEQVKSALVESRKFELLRPEQLSLKEEVEVYSSARVIAGAEGAGLYSACYSGPGSAVISISDEDYAMPILGSLAQYTGFDIGYVFGESMRSEADMSRRPGRLHCDYVVDPSAVVKCVDRSLDLLGEADRGHQ